MTIADAMPLAGATSSLQPGEVAGILDPKGLWGGVPFDPNGAVGNVIFAAMDRAGFKGSFDASLKIDEGGKVHVNATAPAMAGPLQSAFGAKMTAALRGHEVPAGGLTVPWLEGVRNQ